MAIPTKTIVEQIYQGETIKCAKIVSAISSFYKFPGIVNAEGDYEFQAVIRSEETSRIGIQVGDAAVRYIDTYPSFSRYVLPFKQITINESDSLYIYLPPGVYYFYNLQLERGNVATQWQPAPEDAAEYSDAAAEKAVQDQTQLDIFNKLTNNGQSQGIYLLDGELYVNASYIVSGTLIGDLIKGGVISGTEINIGNGVFVVNDQGEVTAANINITGGTIKIDTEGAAAQNSIILRHTWAGVDKSVMISGDHIIYKNGVIHSQRFENALANKIVIGLFGNAFHNPSQEKIIGVGIRAFRIRFKIQRLTEEPLFELCFVFCGCCLIGDDSLQIVGGNFGERVINVGDAVELSDARSHGEKVMNRQILPVCIIRKKTR